MSSRRLTASVAGLALAGSATVALAGCATSNSSTVSSTPSPASTVPFDAPRTPTPTPADPATATTTSKPTPSRPASPTPSAAPAKATDTFARILGLGSPRKGTFTITYDPVVRCTVAAVKAKKAPKECATKPAKTSTDGSWTVNTTAEKRTATLSSTVTGQLYPAGVSFDVTSANLAKQKVRSGTIADWASLTVEAKLTVDAKNHIATVEGTLANE